MTASSTSNADKMAINVATANHTANHVAVVIPCYNEADTLAAVLQKTVEHTDQVIVVDDGSSDATAQVAGDFPVTLLRNETNQGKAESLARGMQAALEAGAARIVTLDGDGQHDPADIPRVVAMAEKYPQNLVIAARIDERENAPPARRFGNAAADFFISWAAGYRVRDTQSGFRLYPARMIRELELNTHPTRGFVFESEIIIEGAWNGHPPATVPIRTVYFTEGRLSHFRPWRDTFQIIFMVAGRILRKGLNLPGLWRVLRHKSPS